MTVMDDINRILRDFERYTGDGKPGAPSGYPLPVGDPSTGEKNISKGELRDLLASIAQAMGDPSALQSILTDLDLKADKADVDPRATPIYPSRASAVSDASSLPAGLKYIMVREGSRLAIRYRTSSTDDPLFSSGDSWGVVMWVPQAADLDLKADKADVDPRATPIYASRAAAVSDAPSLPAGLKYIMVREGSRLAIRYRNSSTDDPLFSSGDPWGVVMWVPQAADLELKADNADVELKADKADVDPRATPIYASRASAVSAAPDLPASLTHIMVREGTTLVIRSQTASADDPLFSSGAQWGVVGRFPEKSLLDYDRSKQDMRDGVGQILLIGTLTNTNGGSYSGTVSTRQEGVPVSDGTLYRFTPNYNNTVSNPNITLDGEVLEIRRSDATAVLPGELVKNRTVILRRSGTQLRLITPVSAVDVGAKSASVNALTINAGSVYPLKAIPRNGVVSTARAGVVEGLLDVKLTKAVTGKFYRIEFYGNGGTVGSGSSAVTGWGLRLSEYDAATYETGNVSGTMLLDYREQIGEPDGYPIGKKVYSIPSRPGMELTLVVDRSAAGEGTTWTMNSGSVPDASSYSWIIDPTRYEYGGGTIVSASSGALDVVTTAGGDLSATWQDADRWYSVTVGPNGFNGLPNIKAVGVAPDSNGAPGAWETTASGTTDWLPPLTFGVADNGDAGPMIYTGGNHGSNGDASGNQTAINRVWRCLLDGKEREWSAFEGAADRIDLTIVNDLLAYNTISLGRYALRQVISLKIRPGGIEGHAEHIPLEPVDIRIDNGLQIVTRGFQNEMMVLGGDPAASGPFQVTQDAGPKSAYPDAWAAMFRNAAGDQMAVWMDRGYEAGNAAMVASDRSLIRPNYGSASGKWYHAVAAGVTTRLQAGEAYKWRGGYQWGRAGRSAPFTAGFDLIRAGRTHDVLVLSAQDWIVAPPM